MLLPKTLILNNTAEAFITVRNLQPNNSNLCAHCKMSLCLAGIQRDSFVSEVRSIPASQGSLWERQVTGNLRKRKGQAKNRKQGYGR